jgi:hypothetical protein
MGGQLSAAGSRARRDERMIKIFILTMNGIALTITHREDPFGLDQRT